MRPISHVLSSHADQDASRCILPHRGKTCTLRGRRLSQHYNAQMRCYHEAELFAKLIEACLVQGTLGDSAGQPDEALLVLATQHRPRVLPPHRRQLVPRQHVNLSQLPQPSIQRLSRLLFPELCLARRQLMCLDLLQCTTSASWAIHHLIAYPYPCSLRGCLPPQHQRACGIVARANRSNRLAKAVLL